MLRTRQKDEAAVAMRKWEHSSNEDKQEVLELCIAIKHNRDMLSDNNYQPAYWGDELHKQEEDMECKERIKANKAALKALGFPAHRYFVDAVYRRYYE